MIIFKRNPEIQQTTFLGHPHSTVSIKSEAVTFSQVGMILKSFVDVSDRFKCWWHLFDVGVDVGANVKILFKRQYLSPTESVQLPLVVHKLWTTTVLKSDKKHSKDMIQ